LAVPLQDLLYFGLRIALSGITAWVALIAWRYAILSRRNAQAWRIPTAGALLLCTASVLSAYDAIDNVIVRPDAPIPASNWAWYLLFDLPMPVWALLAIKAREDRDRAYAKLSELSVTDPLTGVLNRRGFFDRAITAVAHSRRGGASLALLMFDIDHFKAINDSYGHGAGDEVLRNVASTLLSELRAGDLLGRLGGEEFGVLLSDSPAGAAITTGERLRVAVYTKVPHPCAPEKLVTVSCGIAPVPNHLEPEPAFSFALTTADETLYSAKQQGRDRIVTAIRPLAFDPQADVALLRGSAIAPQGR
jgi:diguanylate cyclase (GGDEF)-like protein